MVYQYEGKTDQAIEEYRGILAHSPNEVLSLNNLAVLLAVNRHAPEEALPLAERAVSLATGDPMLLDSLGWIQHLLGKNDQALRSLTTAISAAPNVAELRWHAAVIYAGLQEIAKASSELDAALKLDPKLPEREEDVRKLQQTLNARRPSR
jgi:tetratricopeptide (TPR) repeat protein